MKKLIVLIALVLLSSCKPPEVYTYRITHMDGEVEIVHAERCRVYTGWGIPAVSGLDVYCNNTVEHGSFYEVIALEFEEQK